jgi:hypothetical protein
MLSPLVIGQTQELDGYILTNFESWCNHFHFSRNYEKKQSHNDQKMQRMADENSWTTSTCLAQLQLYSKQKHPNYSMWQNNLLVIMQQVEVHSKMHFSFNSCPKNPESFKIEI